MRTTMKQMKYALLLLVVMVFYGSNETKACNAHAEFTYTFDSTNNFVHFNFTSTSDTTIRSWKYDFGDGTFESSTQNPFHSFNHHNGTYNVCLSVTDNNNCKDTFCELINYSTICEPNPSFLDIFKTGASRITRYTKSNGDIYYKVVEKQAYSNFTGYYLFNCTGSVICQDTSYSCIDQNRPFIDSVVVWNQADTLNADCENLWLNNYTDYDTISSLHITNGGYDDQQIRVLIDSVLIARNSWARRGFIFYVYDSNTGQNWQTYQIGNTCRGPYNDINCNRYPINVFEFITRDNDSAIAKQERKYLINFLNSIPCDAYVLGYSFFNAGYGQWLSDSTQTGDSTLFSALERLGVTKIRNQQENGSFQFFVHTCDSSFTPIQIERFNQGLVVDTTFTYPNIFTGTNGCKSLFIKRYYSNQYGIVYEIKPVNSTNATYYRDCNGNVLLLCGAAADTINCRLLTDSLIYLDTYWQCQSLCDTVTCLLPGDADNDLTVNNYDALAIGLSYNRTGILRPNATTQYILQSCPNWSTTHDYGFNDKFSDCNGDGIINADDALVIDQNYIAQPENIFHHRIGELDSLPAVTLKFDTLPTVIVNGNCVGAQLTSDINVGSATQTATDVYGIAFSVNYPFENDSCFSVQVDLNANSWFQTNDPVLLFYKNIPEYKRLDIALVRTDGVGRTGNGTIGTIKLITEGDIFGIRRMSGNTQYDFSITNVVAINKDGLKIDMNGSSTTVNFVVLSAKQNKVEGLKIYPNPTNDKVFISAKENIESIKIVDTQGRIISEFTPNKNDVQLDISTTENGFYILEIKSRNAVSYEKIFKQ